MWVHVDLFQRKWKPLNGRKFSCDCYEFEIWLLSEFIWTLLT